MEVLFDERGNSFISFFQQFRQVDRAVEGGPEGPIANQAGLRAFVSSDRKQLRVNNARPTARACVCEHSGTCLIARPMTTIIRNRDKILSRCQPADPTYDLRPTRAKTVARVFIYYTVMRYLLFARLIMRMHYFSR